MILVSSLSEAEEDCEQILIVKHFKSSDEMVPYQWHSQLQVKRWLNLFTDNLAASLQAVNFRTLTIMQLRKWNISRPP